jgi:serine/threonine-protein kinase
MQKAEKGNEAGKLVANPIIRFSPGDPRTDLTLFGIEPSGVIGVLYPARKDLDQAVASSLADFRAGATETNPTKTGPDQYEVKLNITHEGWSGLVLLTGRGPFPADIVRPPLGARNTAWQDRFATMADRQGWKADMLWFKVSSQRAGD